MSEAIRKIANILRTDYDALLKLEERLSVMTGKKGIFEKISDENESLVFDRMAVLGVAREASLREIYDTLISKVEADDYLIFKSFSYPDCRKVEACQKIGDVAKKIVNPPRGFFLKLEKAREFLIKEPPRQIMAFLGYDSVSKMLENEDILEVYSALRFIEGSDWLNRVFFKQYEILTPRDFEKREIRVVALDEKWAKESQKFVAQKRHNISHLKELGIIFIIPTLLGISGEILRMFSLIMHYLYEVPFYASIFRIVSTDQSTFANNFVSLLRGDVVNNRPIVSGDKSLWLVVQRYLSKNDPSDWRLFAPHINPEAIHWQKAIACLSKANQVLGGFSKELFFWKDIGWIGDYFKDDSGVNVLVSFDLVDTVMSLVKHKEMVKYLYHHQEELWNKIFAEYFGVDKVEEYSRKYLLKGYFEV